MNCEIMVESFQSEAECSGVDESEELEQAEEHLRQAEATYCESEGSVRRTIFTGVKVWCMTTDCLLQIISGNSDMSPMFKEAEIVVGVCRKVF